MTIHPFSEVRASLGATLDRVAAGEDVPFVKFSRRATHFKIVLDEDGHEDGGAPGELEPKAESSSVALSLLSAILERVTGYGCTCTHDEDGEHQGWCYAVLAQELGELAAELEGERE